MPATTTRTLFSRETRVTIRIAATAERVWELLTDGPRFPSWTTTVRQLTGTIAAGERLSLVSSLAPTRTFSLRVRVFEPHARLVWGDAMGQRTFELAPDGDGVRFTMAERIGGPLFPLFARMIPPFDAAFDAFAADLKRAAEHSPSMP